MAYADVENGLYVGNVGNVYELRRVGDKNRAVVDFSVAAKPRYQNEDGSYEEVEEPVWVNATAWGKLAEHISKTFTKGDRVIIKGTPGVKKGYTKEDGTEVPDRPNLVVDFAGPEILFAPAKVERQARPEGVAGSPRPSGGSNTSTIKKTDSSKAKKAEPKDDFEIDDFDVDDFNDDDQPF